MFKPTMQNMLRRAAFSVRYIYQHHACRLLLRTHEAVKNQKHLGPKRKTVEWVHKGGGDDWFQEIEADKIDEPKLQCIYDDAGRPGAQAFRFAVRRAGLQISEAEARAFVSRQSSGQVFRGRIPSDGKVVGGGREDQRWPMDLIDFSKKIAAQQSTQVRSNCCRPIQ